MYNYVPERHLAPGWNSWPRVLRQKDQSETETACQAQLAMPCSQVYCPCSSVRPLFLTKPGVTTTHIHQETKLPITIIIIIIIITIIIMVTTKFHKFMTYTYDIACFFLSGTQKIKLCKFFATNELQSGLDPRREDTKNYETFVNIPGTPFHRGIHKQLKPSSAFHKKRVCQNQLLQLQLWGVSTNFS